MLYQCILLNYIAYIIRIPNNTIMFNFKQITKRINMYFDKTFKACMSAKAAK